MIRSFAVKTVWGEPAPVIEVRGELDIYTAREFESQLTELVESDHPAVVVDLGGSAFLDASACRALLRAARRLRNHEAELVVVNRDAEIARIFGVMGLGEFLTVVASRDEARDVLAVTVSVSRGP